MHKTKTYETLHLFIVLFLLNITLSEAHSNNGNKTYYGTLTESSFYIPMTDLDAAYLVTPEYEVQIANRLVNLKDIFTYEDLHRLGRAMYCESISSVADYTEFKYKEEMTKIGQTYESGWKFNGSGKRKVNLKIDRQLQKPIETIPTATVSQSKLHIEVSFRKHTFVGWINYSTKSTTKGTLTLSGGPTLNVDYSQHRKSSHDMWYNLAVKISFQNPTYYATFPMITGKMSVDLESFDVQYFDISMNGAYCSIPTSGTIIPTF